MLFHPGDNHSCVQSDGGVMDYRGLNISRERMLELAKKAAGRREFPRFSHNVIDDEEIACYLRLLHEMMMDGMEEGKEETLLFLISALIQNYEDVTTSGNQECRQEIEQACALMDCCYREHINLEWLCSVTSLSKSTLLREFTKFKGVTPYRYLENVRINEARKLLGQGVSPLDAAIQTGFSDQSHFTNYFSRFIGIAPGVYREIFCDRKRGREQELTFAAAGFCGICLYYLLENIALTFTMASNVGVIISVAPFFTGILAHFFMKSEGRLRVNFFVGFVVAMTGIVLIHFNGSRFFLNPLGDVLSVLAAFVWSCYSLLSRKISSFGYPVVPATRRTFFYGILFMMPALFFFDFRIEPSRFADMTYLLNMMYLGVGASALCFVTWNVAVKILGAVKTSIYIYMVPVITIATSVLFLDEPVTWLSAAGTALAVAGLFLSEFGGKAERKR